MVSEQLVHSFTRLALSPDPDLAVAALMIARVEYPRLDAGPYLDELDALGLRRQSGSRRLPRGPPTHPRTSTPKRMRA